MMKHVWTIVLLAALLWNCKQVPDVKPRESATQEKKSPRTLPATIKDIAQFGNIQLVDTSNADNHFNFLEIDQDGMVEKVVLDSVVDNNKTLVKLGRSTTFPIVEIKNTPNVVLAVAGKGYGGVIWGKLLVDKNTLEVHKVAFEHKAESEGYGTGISLSSFENQFVGATIRFEENTYGLNQDGKVVISGIQPIDGISGATITVEAVVKMMNQGLQNYAGYLKTE